MWERAISIAFLQALVVPGAARLGGKLVELAQLGVERPVEAGDLLLEQGICGAPCLELVQARVVGILVGLEGRAQIIERIADRCRNGGRRHRLGRLVLDDHFHRLLSMSIRLPTR